MEMVVKENHFINLTNGVQAIKDYNLLEYRFIRLQSTACEQKRWGFILETISDDLLLRLAIGEKCIVYDYGAHKEIPRAVWQGLGWLRFALELSWLNRIYTPKGRMSTGRNYFEQKYLTLHPNVKNRLKYFKKFLNTDTLYLSSVTSFTTKDGDYEYYNNLIKENK